MNKFERKGEIGKLKSFKEVNGITLIALVITIIVLLILAGVTIATLTGDNGILTRAQDAKERTEQAEKDEKTNLAQTEDLINQYVNGVEVEQVTDENPGVLEGAGTDDDPYTINSIEDLVVFASNVTNGNTYEGQTVKLGLSLDFNSTKSYVDPLRTDYGQYGYDGELKTLLTSGEGFIPIGKYDIETPSDEGVARQNSFEGTFNGNGNVIKNLYINEIAQKDAEQIGLFATNCGEITNLGLTDVNIYVSGKSISIGGIAGGTFGNISGCYVSGEMKCDVTLWSMIGGITGNVRKNLQITECSNRANITCNNPGDNGQATVAGIAGGTANNQYVEINKCYNTGYIYGYSEKKQTNVGGITTGMPNGKITNCYNTGKIEGKGSSTTVIGGIIGNNGGEIKNCYNVGEIIFDGEADSTSIYVGGIAGYNGGTEVSYIYNAKDVKINGQNSNIRIGGLVAGFYADTLSNGYNTGKIIAENTTSENIGSMIGDTNRTNILENCYYLKGTYSKAIGVLNNSAEENNDVTEIEDIADFPSILEVINSDNAFKEDTNNINNGYPLLSWQ